MNLPPRRLTLKSIQVKDQSALALDTGFAADSVEGLRLVKASRGPGWFFDGGILCPWVTKGVLQEAGRLVVWGDLAELPAGQTPEAWPREGAEGKAFLKAFVAAWTSLAPSDLASGFTPSAVVPFQTSSGWAFAFLPAELSSVLDSLQPWEERLSWDHFRHPDLTGAASWAFTSAALAIDLAAGSLPWAQQNEEQLRQEVRDLKKTLVSDELPGSEPSQTFWHQSLTGHGTADRWRAWGLKDGEETNTPDPERDRRRTLALARREQRRHRGAFWRRKGTVITSICLAAAAVLFVVGSVIWGAVKPDPTDTWEPEQVVRGYYTALSSLDDQIVGKLTSFDSSKEAVLGLDKDETTNRYVLRQVRTAYESKSPVVEASAWEAAGKPPLVVGQVLFGLTGLQFVQENGQWTVRYQKWTSEGGDEKTPPMAVGTAVVDHVVLVKTGRGWKISSITRQSQPLF